MMKDEIIRVLHYERFQGGEETPRNLHLLCISCEDEFSRHCLTALPPVGYQITVTNDQAQAISLLSETAVDLVIIGNTTKLKDRAALIFSVKHESPETFVLLLLARGEPVDPFADFVVTCTEYTEYLSRIIHDLVAASRSRRLSPVRKSRRV